MKWIRWRKVLRDLSSNKTRTVLVILSIAIGVFAFGMIAGARYTLSTELKKSYLAAQPASAIFHMTPFDDRAIDIVKQMPEVQAVEGRREVTVRFNMGEPEWRDLKLIAIDDYDDIQINLVRPQRGMWPPPEQYMLLERNALFFMDVNIEDSVLLQMPDGRQRHLRIAGLAHDMNRLPSQLLGLPYGYITLDTLEWLGLSPKFDQLQIIVAEDIYNEAHIEQVADLVTKRLERNGYLVYRTHIPEPGRHPAEDFLPTILLILSSLGTLSLLLSAFLVVNTISAILTQHRQQIGVMKTIGGSTPLIMGLYFRLVLVFGVGALFFAIPLGTLAAAGLSRFIAGQLNFDLIGIQLSPPVLALEIMVGLFVPFLAALYPIVSSTKITVREAISDYGLGKGNFGTSFSDSLLLKIQGILPISRPLRLSLRNTFRRKGRLYLTLLTLTLGGAIFISVLTLRASLFQTLEDTLMNQGFDIQIQFTRPYRVERIAQEINTIPGISTLEGWDTREAAPLRADGTEGEAVILYAPPATTNLYQPDILAGRWLLPDDENAVVIHSLLPGKEPSVGLNKPLILKIGDEELHLQVVGITGDFQPPMAPPTVYLNHRYFAKTIGFVGRTNTVRIITEEHNATAHADISRALETHLTDVALHINSLKTASDDRRTLTERFNIITSILLVMSLLTAVVGSLGLMGTMSINVIERKREIGVMRAIGASNGSVLQIFMTEGILISVISWMGALILSQPISRTMSNEIGQTLLQTPLTYVFSVSGAFLWLLIVIILGALASFLPAWNAARLSVRETLAYE